LDIHGDMNEYIEAKRNIYIHQKPDDTVIFNADNEITAQYAKTAVTNDVLFFSRCEKVENGVFIDNGIIYEAGNGKTAEIMQAEDIFLPGVHNIENYLAAFAAVKNMINHDIMKKTAREFRGVAHRIEFVREFSGVGYYNDSIASSPSRTIAGLKSFEQKVILIAGGKDKGIAFDELGIEINKRVKRLILTGNSAKQIESAVRNAPGHSNIEIVICDDFNEAVFTASKSAVAGDTVLLSPACTSFDKFRNFEERGNLFKKLIMEQL